MPFHAAEQRNKKLKNDSAELRDFSRRLLFVSSAENPPLADKWVAVFSFAFVFFGQAKKMNIFMLNAIK
jgi:hypothetical protein